MNLWLRLISYLITMRWRPTLRVPEDRSVLSFRAWPTDLDPSFHVNNGRYLALMDLGRLDLMVGAGLLQPILRHRWTPIASSVLIRYRRELRLWQRFRLETRLLTWDDTAVVMEQRFVMEGGQRAGQLAALALFKGGIYDRKVQAFVPIARLMAEIGARAEAPSPTPEVAAFLAADDGLRSSAA